MPKEYVTKPVSASPYRVEGRVSMSSGLVKPEVYSVVNGPYHAIVSGVRVDQDRWPSSSGIA